VTVVKSISILVEYSMNCDPLVQILDFIGYLSERKENTFSENKMLKKGFYPRIHNYAHSRGAGQ